MTKSEAFARQHMTRQGMVLYNDYETGCEFVAHVEYGMLRDVYRAQACNYSYREFWL